MPNKHGVNQYGTKDYPADAALLAAFVGYARENSGAGLSAADQIARLQLDFGLSVARNKLFALRRKVGAPSVRKNKNDLSEPQRIQAVLDLKEDDLQGKWGVTAVKQRLANNGVWLTRNNLRTILHDEFDHEFEGRFVGKQRSKSHRIALFALGPWHQEHSDGHEKLSEQGLNIGSGIHLPIYANKDQFASWVHALILMPNVRDQIAIAHYYLDLVEGRDYKISLQITTDLGNEVNEMHKIHEALRAEAAPEFTVDEWPASKKLPSTKNTPIESFWRWQRNGEGHSVKEAILLGSQAGIFSPQDELHKNTFYWIWVPLVQSRLDDFRDYWNHHKLTGNKKKANPYGSSPKNMLLNPQSVRPTARDCSIRVNPETVHRMRESYGGQQAREKAYRFYSLEFEAEANGVYADLGLPRITLETAWDIFRAIVDRLSNLPHYST
ncbi:hypothetical protein GALMADRAFT_94442 [Galerina marginata CBS 339.88]|uniref:Integrase core domain-containing protein n=1 Tax=Galerina marginata (strain CBS 339.88) TaxID=685588 RepID=A0A067TG88_GALM3|nr:hypothetical protein GALMADRAFT_94442 [Galerina marginata CBS 339.88]